MLLSTRAVAGRGMGDACSPFDPVCIALTGGFDPTSPVAPPPVPTSAQLSAPWAGGPSALDAAQTDMVTQQLRAQQALNAAGVQTTAGSIFGGALYNTGQAVGVAAPWVGIALLGLGVIALLILLRR